MNVYQIERERTEVGESDTTSKCISLHLWRWEQHGERRDEGTVGHTDAAWIAVKLGCYQYT